MRFVVACFCIAGMLLMHAVDMRCCINEYRSLLNGALVFVDSHDTGVPYPRFNPHDTVLLRKQLVFADSIYKRSGSIDDYSDFGAMLVYNGRYTEAKQVFLQIEKKRPGLYQTAANLGTAYELLGQNDSALIWIAKAIRINPQSHVGSEWIHVKILEAKVRAEGGALRATGSILSLDFGDNATPENRTGADIVMLREHLYHQLVERMSFVQPKDPIVAQLLFDLGNASAMTLDVKSGLEIFKLARAYGYSSALLDKRQAHLELLQSKADAVNYRRGFLHEHPLLSIIVLISLLCGLVITLRMLIRK